MSAGNWMQQGFQVGVYLAAVASLGLWVHLIRSRVIPRQPLVPPVAREAPTWSLAEFFLCLGAWLVCTTAAAVTIQKRWGGDGGESTNGAEGIVSSPEGLFASAIAISVVNVLVLVGLLAHMGLASRSVLESVGFWPNRSDGRLGLIASLAIVPPVLALATLLDKLVPYEHPVFDAINQTPSLELFLVMTVGTVLVTPLLEEFMFRGLLQTGFERLARLAEFRQAAAADETKSSAGVVWERDWQRIEAAEVAFWPWWPVVSSSIVFSLMHLGHGAAPISLFFFSLGTAYLYRQTGRLWPCVVVHAVLNAISMLGLGLSMLAEP